MDDETAVDDEMTADGPTTDGSVAADPSGRDVPPKATLFCPDCGHRNRVDGDWDVVETARVVRYVCPDCRTGIASRPTDTEGSRPRSIALWKAWGAGLRAWGRLWFRTVLPTRTDG